MIVNTIQSASQSNYKIKRTFDRKIVGHACRLVKSVTVIESDQLVEVNVACSLPTTDTSILESDTVRLYPRFNKEYIEIMRIEDSSIVTVIDESMALSCSEIMHLLSKKDFGTACGISVVPKIKHFVNGILKGGWEIPSGDDIFEEVENRLHLIKDDNSLKTINFEDEIMHKLRNVEGMFKNLTDITFQDEGIYFRKTKIDVIVLFNKVILNITYNDFECKLVFEP